MLPFSPRALLNLSLRILLRGIVEHRIYNTFFVEDEVYTQVVRFYQNTLYERRETGVGQSDEEKNEQLSFEEVVGVFHSLSIDPPTELIEATPLVSRVFTPQYLFIFE
jgi:hypothetical protein